MGIIRKKHTTLNNFPLQKHVVLRRAALLIKEERGDSSCTTDIFQISVIGEFLLKTFKGKTRRNEVVSFKSQRG
jgi:hypothetical protein